MGPEEPLSSVVESDVASCAAGAETMEVEGLAGTVADQKGHSVCPRCRHRQTRGLPPAATDALERLWTSTESQTAVTAVRDTTAVLSDDLIELVEGGIESNTQGWCCPVCKNQNVSFAECSTCSTANPAITALQGLTCTTLFFVLLITLFLQRLMMTIGLVECLL
jgi:hypothetical protein